MWSATFLLLLNFISNDSEGLELRLSGHEVAIDVLPIVSEYSICRGYHIRQQKTALKFTVLMYGFDSCEDKASKPPLKADNLDDEEQSKVLALANYFGIYHAPNKLGLRFSLKFAQLKEKVDWFVDNKGSETVVLVERSFNRDIVRITFESVHQSGAPHLALLLYFLPQTNEIIKTELHTKNTITK
ncbi:hypothetical protein L1286_12730 [Pseudoalteromonas sp. SMS1]|uniref:hypothetical protein n=1 Tax=Pseudoalteromonas sp. SMS1 TaxID=2908894 RepID=UPI001F3DF7AF|nr:hypothetical protein [Pseudoalteromonas sp. SMS1]MCF2858345.1 hypothetical protein [Pseudoalteromonas sp. SMS1]